MRTCAGRCVGVASSSQITGRCRRVRSGWSRRDATAARARPVRSRATASRQARVLPVEGPPTAIQQLRRHRGLLLSRVASRLICPDRRRASATSTASVLLWDRRSRRKAVGSSRAGDTALFHWLRQPSKAVAVLMSSVSAASVRWAAMPDRKSAAPSISAVKTFARAWQTASGRAGSRARRNPAT